MPKLALVTGDSSVTKPPRKLGRHGSQLWRSIMREYVLDDAADLETLALACEQLDRAQECREQIDRDGLMIRSKHGPKDHPLLKAELAARSYVSRTLQRLGLGAEATKPVGRPPQPHGWQPDDDE
jgi:P27 family predicted phage terminase small subunit